MLTKEEQFQQLSLIQNIEKEASEVLLRDIFNSGRDEDRTRLLTVDYNKIKERIRNRAERLDDLIQGKFYKEEDNL